MLRGSVTAERGIADLNAKGLHQPAEAGMNMDNARLLVIGAGVNGSVCAAGLHKAGIALSPHARSFGAWGSVIAFAARERDFQAPPGDLPAPPERP